MYRIFCQLVGAMVMVWSVFTDGLGCVYRWSGLCLQMVWSVFTPDLSLLSSRLDIERLTNGLKKL